MRFIGTVLVLTSIACTQQSRMGTGAPAEPGGAVTYRSRIHGRPELPLQPISVHFARYLNDVHRALHPRFTGRLVASPTRGPRKIHALAEIVIDGRSGSLVQTGVIETSGVPGFDAGVVQSIHEAFPVTPVPAEIRSVDGMVYVLWEFWDEPEYACSTYFARPYRLADKPSTSDALK